MLKLNQANPKQFAGQPRYERQPDGSMIRITPIFAGRKGKGKARERYEIRERVAPPAAADPLTSPLARVLGLGRQRKEARP